MNDIKRFAFFDVDNTIYSGYTVSEVLLFLQKQGAKVDHLLEIYYKTVEDYGKRKVDYHQLSQIVLDLFSRAFAGWNVDQANKLIKEMLSAKGKIFNDWALPVVDFLKANKYEVVLVSAGADIVIKEISDRLGADRWIATTIETRAGIYTGANVVLMNNEAKRQIVEDILEKAEKSMSIGFGDSTGDIPMLEAVDHQFVVHSDHHLEMMQYAEKKGWNIFSSSAEVLNILDKLQ